MAQVNTPPIRLHKATQQAYVTLNERRIYLGRYDNPEIPKKYHRLLSEWYANGCRPKVSPDDVIIKELVDRYYAYCKTYYRCPDGSFGSGVYAAALALRPLLELYGDTKAFDFGPLALRGIREKWIKDGLRRTTINKRVGVIKRMFRFGVGHQLVSPSVLAALDAVEGLHKGRSAAKESRVVSPVTEAHVEAIEPYVSRQVWGLVRLQLFTGARSGEILALRRIDIDTSGSIWFSRIERHKTSHRGRDRMLYFGPKAQAVLKEFFFGKGPADFLFSAADAERERNTARNEGAATPRRKNQKADIPITDRSVGETYTANSYRRAIVRACALAGVPEWHPHRLRHSAATRIRKELGLEAAQIWLGHSDANITQVYAEVDHARALEIAATMG